MEKNLDFNSTKGQAIQYLEVLRSIKSYDKLSKDGALNIIRNGVHLGRIAKEFDNKIKDIIEAIRTGRFLELVDLAEIINSKKKEERTDEDNAILDEFAPLNRIATKQFNQLRNELLEEGANINILKITEEDFYALLSNTKNESVTSDGFDILYEYFVIPSAIPSNGA